MGGRKAENKEVRIARVKREKTRRNIEHRKLRIERKKLEAKDPELKRKRLEVNVPKTIDNTRPIDPTMVTIPSGLHPSILLPTMAPKHHLKSPELPTGESRDPQMDPENLKDLANDPFADYFNPDTTGDPSEPPSVLITTSPYATKVTLDFCEELVGVFPGAQFFRRRKRKETPPPMGKIAKWAAKRNYSSMIVVNEDHKKPNAITMIHLPSGPTAYFKLTSVQLTREIYVHARASPHYPELVLNNFVTRLGHAVGRMFQTLFPPMPEFEGRQVVTLHNQRDYMFFRRHRYMFKSMERTGLQEIGPRFTLKLRTFKTGLPQDNMLGAPIKPLEFAKDDDEVDKDEGHSKVPNCQGVSPAQFSWVSNPRMELNKRTFFL